MKSRVFVHRHTRFCLKHPMFSGAGFRTQGVQGSDSSELRAWGCGSLGFRVAGRQRSSTQ